MNENNVVEDAKNGLTLFLKGLPIDAILHLYPVSYFDSNPVAVWQATFEEYPDAIGPIEKMGLYCTFGECEKNMHSEVGFEIFYARSVARTAVQILLNKMDAPDFGLTLDQVAKTMKVFLGHPHMVKAMLEEAETRLNDWSRIVKEKPVQFQKPDDIKKHQEVKRIVDAVFNEPS